MSKRCAVAQLAPCLVLVAALNCLFVGCSCRPETILETILY